MTEVPALKAVQGGRRVTTTYAERQDWHAARCAAHGGHGSILSCLECNQGGALGVPA